MPDTPSALPSLLAGVRFEAVICTSAVPADMPRLLFPLVSIEAAASKDSVALFNSTVPFCNTRTRSVTELPESAVTARTSSPGISLAPGVPFTRENIDAAGVAKSDPSSAINSMVPSTSLSCTIVDDPIVALRDFKNERVPPEAAAAQWPIMAVESAAAVPSTWSSPAEEVVTCAVLPTIRPAPLSTFISTLNVWAPVQAYPSVKSIFADDTDPEVTLLITLSNSALRSAAWSVSFPHVFTRPKLAIFSSV